VDNRQESVRYVCRLIVTMSKLPVCKQAWLGSFFAIERAR